VSNTLQGGASDKMDVYPAGTNRGRGTNDDDYHFSDATIWGCVIVFVGLMVASICIGESIQYVEYDEYALLKNKYSGVRLGKVYEAGRYFYPLTYELLVFPATFRKVDFAASVFRCAYMHI
jgi:hypothetical protein